MSIVYQGQFKYEYRIPRGFQVQLPSLELSELSPFEASGLLRISIVWMAPSVAASGHEFYRQNTVSIVYQQWQHPPIKNVSLRYLLSENCDFFVASLSAWKKNECYIGLRACILALVSFFLWSDHHRSRSSEFEVSGVKGSRHDGSHVHPAWLLSGIFGSQHFTWVDERLAGQKLSPP